MKVMIIGIGYVQRTDKDGKRWDGPVLHMVYPDGIVRGNKADKKYLSNVQGDYDYSPAAVAQVMNIYQSSDVRFPFEADIVFGRNDVVLSVDVLQKDVK